MIYQRGETDSKLVNLNKQKGIQKQNDQNHGLFPQNKVGTNFQLFDQKQSSKFHVCFNPSCSLPFSRVFKSEHSHYAQNACLNWTLSDNQFQSYLESGSLQRGKTNESQQKNYSLNIGGKRMIQNVHVLSYTKGTDWNKYYESLLLVLKEKIQKEYNEIIKNLQQRMESLRCQDTIANIEELFQNIRNHKKNDVENRKQVQYIVNEFILPISNQVITIQQPRIEHFSLFSKLHVLQGQKQIFGNQNRELGGQKQRLGERLQYYQRQGKDNMEQKESKDQLIQFMLDCPSPFNKIQQVASFCGNKCQDFTFRGNVISLKCPFCQFRYADKHRNLTNDKLKMVKKQIGMEVISHLIKDHYNMISLKYGTKYFKKSSSGIHFQNSLNSSNQTNRHGSNGYEITFEQFIKEMLQNNYKNLHIIDRETGITQIPNISKQCYVVEVISRSNKGQARLRHLMTPDRKCTEFIINYIAVYACWIGNYVKSENVHFYSNSKDINQFLSIVEVLERKPIEKSVKNENRNDTKRQYLQMERTMKQNNGGQGYEGRLRVDDNIGIVDRLIFGQDKDGRDELKGMQLGLNKIKFEGDK